MFKLLKRKKYIFIIGIIIIIILVWSPWFYETTAKDLVLARHPELGNRFAEAECHKVNVYWVPFGRLVSDCEGGWVVTFWGNVL